MPARPVTELERLWLTAERTGERAELGRRRLLLYWQLELGKVPVQKVVDPALSEFSRTLLRAFRQRAGICWQEEDGETLELAKNPLMPCQHCGKVFTSKHPRFTELCERCSKPRRTKAASTAS